MGISRYNIVKWYKMFAGKSVLHVDQGVGQMFEANKIAGYFNDMTMKVTMQMDCVDKRELPKQETEQGDHIYFPVAVFQFGLGLWDLFLKTNEDRYREMFVKCAEWALEKQESNGAWNNFFFVYPDNPYGAMAQGEGASLLIRAWELTKDDKYLEAARNAISFMLIPVEDGGTAKYEGEDLILLEYTHLAPVLNGWIFSAIGLYDIWLATNNEDYKQSFDRSIKSLLRFLPQFDCNYWSDYDLNKHITSLFYHRLHIAQLKALYLMTGREAFKEYAERWEKYLNNPLYKSFATLKKAAQKIRE